MHLSPDDIRSRAFNHSLRGYNEEQVDTFLAEVAEEVECLYRENVALTARLQLLTEHAAEPASIPDELA